MRAARLVAGSLFLIPALASAGALTSQADLGATFFLGSAGENAAPGPAFGARIGWSPRGWLDLSLQVRGSTHSATVPPPPDSEFFQIYQGGAGVRFAARIGRIGLVAEGGGGIAFISTNVLDAVGITSPIKHWGPYITGGGGLEYHTDNPRFALGVGGDFGLFPDFDFMQAVSVHVYLRYTR